MVPALRRMCVLVAFAAVTAEAARGDDPYGDNPRLGGRAGRLNSRITRSPYENVEMPDVLTLKGGVRREAYFLNVYGDRFVYYVKESERAWLREEVSRAEVESVDFQQYLPEDPVAPRKIEPAAKQPAKKDDVLSGVFRAYQGRSIAWTASFQSDLDKFSDFTEDATDYGTIELRSAFVQQVRQGLPPEVLPRGNSRAGTDSIVTWPSKGVTRSHEVRAQGKYYLYAPETVHNSEWVLVLTEVIQTEVDHGRDTSLLTTSVPDETLILYFSPQKDSFRLAWSNVGRWTWSSLVDIRFERLPGEWEEEPREAFPAKPALPTLPGASRREIPVLASAEPTESSPRLREKLGSSSAWRTGRSKLDGWKRPQYRLGAGR